jgi:O-acetylhomoserine/O-acetylserine sulfhydrylase-like pyridoxal-dependent enzyme
MMGFTTKLLHSDRRFGVEHGNLVKPMHPGVTYGYEDVHDLNAVFQGKQKGYTYGRQINPTVEGPSTEDQLDGAGSCEPRILDGNGGDWHHAVCVVKKR